MCYNTNTYWRTKKKLMKRSHYVPKQNFRAFILMGITVLLITVAGIVFHQSPLRILPLYVSLVIGILQSRVNRLSFLIGGINSILYALVYAYYNLYASALYALLISFPLQIVTFLRWKKHAWGHSVQLKRMSEKQRLVSALLAIVLWLGMCGLMTLLGSSYMLLDNTITLLGIVIIVLTLPAYIEYTMLTIPNGIVSIALYLTMLVEKPQQLTYLIFSLYNLICSLSAFFHARSLYRAQQPTKVG